MKHSVGKVLTTVGGNAAGGYGFGGW